MGSRCWKSVEIDKNQYFERLLKFEMPDAGINGKLIKKSICLEAPYVLNGPPMLEIIIFYMLSNGARRWVSNGVSGAPGVGRGTVLAPPRPAMPELLAGARFWGHRGRKRWQGYGFGTSMAANVGRGTVMGIWFCTHTDVSPGTSQ